MAHNKRNNCPAILLLCSSFPKAYTEIHICPFMLLLNKEIVYTVASSYIMSPTSYVITIFKSQNVSRSFSNFH